MARPSKYKPEFHPKSFIEHSREGLNKAEICAEWGVSRDTLYRWKDEKPEFSDAVGVGEAALEAWFSREFKGFVMKARGGSLQALIWLSRNCVGWTEKLREPEQDKEIKIHIYENERCL